MRRITVRNTVSGKHWIYQGEAPEGDKWLEKHTKNNTFGKPAVYETVFNEETQTDETVLVSPAEEFTVLDEDITAEIEAEETAKNNKRVIRQSARDALNLTNIDTITTLPELKTVVKNILVLLRE